MTPSRRLIERISGQQGSYSAKDVEWAENHVDIVAGAGYRLNASRFRGFGSFSLHFTALRVSAVIQRTGDSVELEVSMSAFQSLARAA